MLLTHSDDEVNNEKPGTKIARISRHLTGFSQQFEIIKYQPVYCLSISIRLGVSTAQISFSDLGFSDEEISAKQAALIKTNAPIVLFPKLRECGSKLNAIKKSLQDKYMVNGNRRWWFVLEDKIDNLVEEINGILIPTCEQLKAEILSSFEENKANYQQRLSVGIAEFLPPEKRETVVKKYLSAFPTISDIEQDFAIDIDGPIRISSILEDAAVAEKASILSLHKQWKESILNNLEGALKEATDEIYELVADLLGDIEKTPASDLSNKAKARMETTLSRLTLLVDFNNSLGEIFTDSAKSALSTLDKQVSSITQEYLATSDDYFTSFAGQIKFRERLKKMREEFKTTLDLSGDGKGHRAIAQWMSIL